MSKKITTKLQQKRIYNKMKRDIMQVLEMFNSIDTMLVMDECVRSEQLTMVIERTERGYFTSSIVTRINDVVECYREKYDDVCLVLDTRQDYNANYKVWIPYVVIEIIVNLDSSIKTVLNY